MIITFLSHIYKNFFRSSSVGKDIAIQIMLGFIVVSLVGYSLAVGFALENIIVNTLKQKDAIAFLNGLLIYYFIGGFITRYFIQSLPALDVQPYLHLPIPRSKIVNFLLGKSLIHVLNIFVFLVFTPFALTAIAREYGIAQTCVWLLSLWFLSLINHFLVILAKRHLTQSVWVFLIFIIICTLFAGADYFGWLKLSVVSEKLFHAVLQGYTVAGVLSLLVILLYYSAYRTFINRLYPEELSVQENKTLHSANWTFLQNFGLIGAWIRVELKLIFRNKRSRELFFMNGMFFFVVLILSYVQRTAGDIFFLFFGIISSGFFTANYGQFLFSWQGKHFDFSITQPTSIQIFVESKYWLLTAITILWFLFSIPLVFFGWHFLLVNFVCVLFNVGVSTFIIMNMSMWGANSIDLTHKGTLNYEGIGAAQWVMGIPFMFAPFVIYLPFFFLGYPFFGIIAVGLAGLTGIVFHRKLLEITAKRLSNLRYTMAANFRKD